MGTDPSQYAQRERRPRAAGRRTLKFSQAYEFESPSAAAGVVSGTGLNGRAAWKVKGTGESYKDWLEKQVSNAAEDVVL